MNLLLIRRWSEDNACVGTLYWTYPEGSYFECYTLERVDRIIPTGTYPLIIDYSDRFGREMPHICDVPGRTGIRIHVANYPHELQGCIAVGKERGPMDDRILMSRVAFNEFMPKIRNELAKGSVSIKIQYEGV